MTTDKDAGSMPQADGDDGGEVVYGAAPERFRVKDAKDADKVLAEVGDAVTPPVEEEGRRLPIVLMEMRIMAKLDDMTEALAFNSTALRTMLAAMEEAQPDDVVDEGALSVWRVTAETTDGVSLGYTVRCDTMTEAIRVAVNAWGHEPWKTLRRCGDCLLYGLNWMRRKYS